MSPRKRRLTRENLLQELNILRHRLAAFEEPLERPSPEDLLRTLEAFTDGLVLLHDDLTVERMTRGGEKLFGWSAADVEGQPITTLLPGDAIESHVTQMRHARAAGEPVAPRRLSMDARRAAGEHFRVEVTLAMRRFTAPSGWMLGVRSMAGMQAVLESLEAVEHRYAALAEVVPVAIFRTDAQGRCIYVSQRWCEMTGFGMLDALGDGWRSVLHPEDQDRVSAAWDQAMADNLPVRVEERIRRVDGRVVWALAQVLPERDASGRVIGFVGALTDITPEKLLEDALRGAQAQFRLIFQENPIPMWVYDEETLFFLEVNAAAVRRYGWSREEFLRRKITDIRPPEEIPELMEVLKSRPPGWYGTRAWRHRLADGTTVPVAIASHPLRFNDRPAVLVTVWWLQPPADEIMGGDRIPEVPLEARGDIG